MKCTLAIIIACLSKQKAEVSLQHCQYHKGHLSYLAPLQF